MVWGSLCINPDLPGIVGELTCTQGPELRWAMDRPSDVRDCADHRVDAPALGSARRSHSWPARAGDDLTPDRSGEARASLFADYPRRGLPSPLLALPKEGHRLPPQPEASSRWTNRHARSQPAATAVV